MWMKFNVISKYLKKNLCGSSTNQCQFGQHWTSSIDKKVMKKSFNKYKKLDCKGKIKFFHTKCNINLFLDRKFFFIIIFKSSIIYFFNILNFQFILHLNMFSLRDAPPPPISTPSSLLGIFSKIFYTIEKA